MTMLQEKKEYKYSVIEYDRNTNFEEGILAIELNKLDKAEKIFIEMLYYNEEDYEAINKLGIVYAKKKDIMLAREYFEQALAIKEDYGPSFVNIGNTYKEGGDNVRAKEYYELAIENDPQYYLSYYNLAIIYKSNNNYNEYMKYMKEYKNMYKLSMNKEKYLNRRKYKNKKNYIGVILIFIFFIMLMYLLK